jgi:hypothetical protein
MLKSQDFGDALKRRPYSCLRGQTLWRSLRDRTLTVKVKNK